jgi:Asp-tRNA(Asn)/Glu-tRNA(Gln) amidotransferase A subunit family amidase
MTSAELTYLSATKARRLFRSRELSPVELMCAIVTRTEQLEPRINAFTERLFDDALEQARKAEDAYLGKNGRVPRPLEGIPVATKEKHGILGHTLTEGSLTRKDEIATENHPLVDRILEAGGIIHARTATPEFSIATYTHSRLWGVTRNPWNLDVTPGGSSGGAGASLAAGTTLLASASDIGGSTRIPAAFTGTVGFKAPYGRNPGYGPITADHYRGDGPMGRTVDDVIAFQNVLAGPDPRDHTAIRPKLTLPTVYDDRCDLRERPPGRMPDSPGTCTYWPACRSVTRRRWRPTTGSSTATATWSKPAVTASLPMRQLPCFGSRIRFQQVWYSPGQNRNSIVETCVKSARTPTARVPHSVKYDSVMASATRICIS